MHSQLYIRIMNSKQWKAARTLKLATSPLCEECKKEGKYVQAQCVHHLTEIESARTEADAWQLATSQSNLQSLCYRHHHDIHAAKHSHSKQAHKQREAERLERWKQRNMKAAGIVLDLPPI